MFTLDFPIIYRNVSVICQSKCACLHKTVNMVVFFVKSSENTYPKGRALMKMYRVVSKTRTGKTIAFSLSRYSLKVKECCLNSE